MRISTYLEEATTERLQVPRRINVGDKQKKSILEANVCEADGIKTYFLFQTR